MDDLPVKKTFKCTNNLPSHAKSALRHRNCKGK